MEGTLSPSVIGLDQSPSTPTEVIETTLGSTPRRSLRSSRPSTPLVVNDSPLLTSKTTPKSTAGASPLNRDQNEKSNKDWIFPIPATTPKKLAASTPKKHAKTPDSKSNGSPSLSMTPQKDSAGSLPGTPSKLSDSTDSLDLYITPLNKTPSKTIDALKWSGLSPYRSNRPKYLPKNIKLFKKKQLERQQNLQNLVKVNERLLQTTRAFSKETPKFDVWMNHNPVSDPMGTVLPRSDVFSPQSYFVTFDERSLDVNDFVSADSVFASKSIADIIEGLRNGTLLITCAAEFRFCLHLLTVTTSRHVFYSIFSLIIRRIGKDFCLGWTDLKEILVNFGLTKDTRKYCTAPSNLNPPPQRWNLEFLLLLIDKSFHTYRKSCTKRLMCLLIDSLFESILLDLHNKVVALVRRVCKHLLKKKVSIEEMIYLINRSYLSTTHNRFIVQYLAAVPELVPLARGLGIHTIYNVARVEDSIPIDVTPSQIMSFLNEKFDVIVTVSIQHIHQLLLICEKLFLLSGFDPLDIEKLAAFAKRISMRYTYFDSLNFNVTVSRLDALASCSSL